MVNNGDGTFTIKNSQTGETKTVGANELGNYGLSAPNTQSQPKDYGLLGNLLGIHLGSGVDTTSNQSLGGANALGDILMPRAAAVSHLQAQGQEPSLDQRIGVVGEAANRLLAPFLGPIGLAAGGLAEGATKPGASLQDRAIGGITQGAVEGGSGLVLSKVGELLPFLTKSGVGQKIGQKVTDATNNGATDTWNDFSTEVKQAVAKKLGNDEPYQSIVNSRLNAETPASIEENPTVTPQNYLDLRQQAANREPTGIFAKFQGKSPENQVDEVIRQVASGRLKELAGTGNLDKLYSIYSKFGSPAEIVGRTGATGAISQLVPEQYRSQAQSGLTGGAELLKILGIL